MKLQNRNRYQSVMNLRRDED